MPPTAIVPVRITPLAKRRLAHLVPARARADLVRSLFDHVTRTLLDAGLDVVALAPHPIDVPDDVELWADEAPTLNGALAAAAERTGVPVALIHADLPLLTVDDVWALIDAPGDVVIARSLDGGTNALLLRAKLRPMFGRNSALVHARRARAEGLRARVIDRPGLALDVDDPAALTASSSPLPSSSRQRIL